MASGFVFHRSPYQARFRRSFMSVTWREGVAVLELRPDRTGPVTAMLPLHPDSTLSSLGEEEVLPARGGGSGNGGLTLTTLQLRWPAVASGRGGRLGGSGKVDVGSALTELPLPASRTASGTRSRSRSRSRSRTLAKAAGRRRPRCIPGLADALTALSMLLSLFALLATALLVGPTLIGAPVEMPAPGAGVIGLAQAHARVLGGSIRSLPTDPRDFRLNFMDLDMERIVDEGKFVATAASAAFFHPPSSSTTATSASLSATRTFEALPASLSQLLPWCRESSVRLRAVGQAGLAASTAIWPKDAGDRNGTCTNKEGGSGAAVDRADAAGADVDAAAIDDYRLRDADADAGVDVDTGGVAQASACTDGASAADYYTGGTGGGLPTLLSILALTLSLILSLVSTATAAVWASRTEARRGEATAHSAWVDVADQMHCGQEVGGCLESIIFATPHRLVVGEYTAATSCCFLLLRVAPSVSCSCLDARRTLRDTSFHRLLPSPSVSQCLQPV